MGQYYHLLLKGIVASYVRWTTPYRKPGFGHVVTTTVAVYDRSQAAPAIVGVIAADVPLDQLTYTGVDEDGQAVVGQHWYQLHLRHRN